MPHLERGDNLPLFPSWPTLVIKSGSRKTPGRDKRKIDNKLLGVNKQLINEHILLQNVDLQMAGGCSVSATASIQDCSHFSFWEKVEIGVPEFSSWLFGGFSVTKNFLKHLDKGCFYVFQAWFQFPIANRQDQTSMTFKWTKSSTSFQHRPHSCWPMVQKPPPWKFHYLSHILLSFSASPGDCVFFCVDLSDRGLVILLSVLWYAG